MKKKSIIGVLALMLILLVACGGQEETGSEPALEPAPTAEAEVAATEPPPATEVPEVASPLDMMEHVSDPQLVDIVWQWQERTTNMGEETLITVPDPAAYTLTFNPDGSFNAQVDCNNIQGQYATDMPGNIFMEAGPSTRAFCGEDSLDQEMLKMFGPAQSYVFEEDDQVLVLKWVAGGPYDYFRDAAAEESTDEEAQAVAEDAIQMDLQGLAETFDWTIQPASPIPTEPEEGFGFPPHVLITFDGESAEDVLANNGRRMLLFPSQAYIDLYNAADDSIVADQFERLLQILRESGGRQEPPENPMPVLPPPASFMDRWTQFRELVFEGGRGVSYVSDSPYRQDIGVWTNETTGYYFQGLSEDGLFYVSLFWPAGTAGLPNTAADAAPDVTEQATNPETNAAYVQDTLAMLNATSEHDWNPDLAKLDAMVESLTFAEPGEGDEIALPVPGAGESAGTVLAPAGVNVRVGPAAGYPSLGVAPFGTTGILIGKSEDEEWWAVEVPVDELAPEGLGWVAAEFVQATDAEDLAVVAGPTKLETLQLVPWQWSAIAEPAGMTAVDDPQNYTISFDDQGMAEIKADCNNVTAEYTADEDNLTMTMGPSTMVACSPDSQDQLFLASLEQTAVYRFEDGDLFFDLDEGAGIMRFEILDE